MSSSELDVWDNAPKPDRELSTSDITCIESRFAWYKLVSEMSQLCDEAARRLALASDPTASHFDKPLSRAYIADRIAIDEPIRGYLVRSQEGGWMQGFVVHTPFTTWQQDFRWTVPPASDKRKVDDGTIAGMLNEQYKDGDPLDGGVVWPRVAEISLLGSLGCGGWLLRYVMQELAAGGQYDFLVLQSTKLAVPFYEHLGFVHVGAEAAYEPAHAPGAQPAPAPASAAPAAAGAETQEGKDASSLAGVTAATDAASAASPQQRVLYRHWAWDSTDDPSYMMCVRIQRDGNASGVATNSLYETYRNRIVADRTVDPADESYLADAPSMRGGKLTGRGARRRRSGGKGGGSDAATMATGEAEEAGISGTAADAPSLSLPDDAEGTDDESSLSVSRVSGRKRKSTKPFSPDAVAPGGRAKRAKPAAAASATTSGAKASATSTKRTGFVPKPGDGEIPVGKVLWIGRGGQWVLAAVLKWWGRRWRNSGDWYQVQFADGKTEWKDLNDTVRALPGKSEGTNWSFPEDEGDEVPSLESAYPIGKGKGALHPQAALAVKKAIAEAEAKAKAKAGKAAAKVTNAKVTNAKAAVGGGEAVKAKAAPKALAPKKKERARPKAATQKAPASAAKATARGGSVAGSGAAASSGASDGAAASVGTVAAGFAKRAAVPPLKKTKKMAGGARAKAAAARALRGSVMAGTLVWVSRGAEWVEGKVGKWWGPQAWHGSCHWYEIQFKDGSKDWRNLKPDKRGNKYGCLWDFAAAPQPPTEATESQ